jgi:hypothetical protein
MPEQAFDLSLDVEAHTGSMARSRERVIRGVMHGRLGLDDQVTWRARHFGLPWTMTSKVTEWDRPNRFVDEQVAGPFASSGMSICSGRPSPAGRRCSIESRSEQPSVSSAVSSSEYSSSDTCGT